MATKDFPAYFAENGTPKTGLSPTINIYRLSDGTKVVNAVAMTEIGEGGYNYRWTSWDAAYAYYYVCDSVTLDSHERYASGSVDAENRIVEGALTQDEILRGLLAVFMAKRQGMATGQTQFRDQADTKNRIDAVMDGNGNILSVTLDLT